jgi:hypothetical protein
MDMPITKGHHTHVESLLFAQSLVIGIVGFDERQALIPSPSLTKRIDVLI